MLRNLTLRILVISLVFSIIGFGICNMAFAQKRYLMYYMTSSGTGDPYWAAQKKWLGYSMQYATGTRNVFFST